jgi:hypothetical protein
MLEIFKDRKAQQVLQDRSAQLAQLVLKEMLAQLDRSARLDRLVQQDLKVKSVLLE